MTDKSESWMSSTLWVAGLYNLAWAAFAVLAPPAFFPELSLIPGILVGALGVGFLLSASDPVRQWRIVLVGLIGKLAAAAAICWAVWRQRIPVSSLWLAFFDDLIWLAPFALILYAAHECLLNQRRSISPEVVRMALRKRTQHEVTLDEISRLSPVLLVFLRHSGCTFCREALSDLAAARPAIEASGTGLVLVHMGTEDHGRRFFAKYGLSGAPRVSDPERSLYRAFGLRRGSLLDLLGPKVWLRGFQAGILKRHGAGRLAGDGFQMPGVFLVYHGEILRSYRHESAADRPNYLALATGNAYARPEVGG